MIKPAQGPHSFVPLSRGAGRLFRTFGDGDGDGDGDGCFKLCFNED